MKIVKLLVLVCCVINGLSYRREYCKICRNHTLCKYPVSGPGAKCRGFDKGALLTDGDIVEILNRINSRRNLVASGHLNRLPQAANMRKMQWSQELARFAQRWADQCDLLVKPNREDDCRDLVGMQVWQSIATVVGPTPGMNVRSFVDMWFMVKLQYTGSTVYYNRSRDNKTDHFTQLIWADTEYVGCGKAKFFNENINTVVERLICNFAPKGNIHGKPVYASGFPATQCPNFMTPDAVFPSLCKQNDDTATETVQGFSVSSLLRILDLSNSSAKQALDPNNYKQISLNSTDINDQRNQKTRHAHLNNSYGAIKRDSFHIQNPIHDAESYKAHQFTPERGHSKMYHGFQTIKQTIPRIQTTPSFSEEDFRRYGLSTTAHPYSDHDHDHRYVLNRRSQVCTRKQQSTNMDCFTTQYVTDKCTRGEPRSCNSCADAAHSCNSCLQSSAPPVVTSHDLCNCNNQITRSTVASQCDSITKCQCASTNCPKNDCPTNMLTTFCAKRRAQGDEANKATQFNYYDLFPNMGVRSIDEISNQQKHFVNPEMEDNMDNRDKETEMSSKVKGIAGNLQANFRRPQDLYGVFYSSERRKRDFEDQVTFKPFWQMDEYNYKRPSELKSLKYTTLGDKRNRKTRRTTYVRLPTESITINHDLLSNDRHNEHITEKYLSFEELMHLRKLSTSEAFDYEARRFGDEYALRQAKPVAAKTVAKTVAKPAVTPKPGPKPLTTTKARLHNKPSITAKPSAKTTLPAKRPVAISKTTATIHKPTTRTSALVTISKTVATKPTTKAPVTTTTMTANTQFVALKQCTRKLTCTWTAITIKRNDGRNVFAGGGGADNVGSRTPQGYVEGCSRTSTCTRDYIDRNKMATLSTPDANQEDSPEESTSKDDNYDYCEKRSLDMQKRNLDDKDKILSIEFQEAFTEISSSTPLSHVTNREIVDSEISRSKDSCICYENNGRIKRRDTSNYDQLRSKSCYSIKKSNGTENIETYNYDNPFFSMLQKISKSSKFKKKPHRCPCNSSKSIHNLLLYWVHNLLIYYAFT